MKQLYSSGILLLLLFAGLVSTAQIRYATGVIAFSSQYSNSSWSAAQTLGAPNTAGCGDINTSWASGSSDGQREFLELEFADPAPINRVYIHETLAPGAVDTVYVFNPGTQQYEKVFEATAAAGAPCPRRFSIIFPQTSFPVSRIRIAINSVAVAGYNEIDAVGISLLAEGGAIGSDQEICSSAPPAVFLNTDPAFNGDAGVVYAWQDSTENGSWQDIPSASAATYQAPVLAKTTWYRRKATLGGIVAFSNEIKMNFHESGDPSVIPQDSWNFYVYKANSLDMGGAVYKGYYSRTPLYINTMVDWANPSTPSAAAGYQGCAVLNNEQYLLIAKRRGFPVGNYRLVTGFSAYFRVYVNGTAIDQPVCCSASISLGALDNNSVVELRVLSNFSNTYIQADFQVADLNGGSIGESQALCMNDAPSLFVNKISAYGGAAPASITYQWQDSTSGRAWNDIPSATGATYQAGALTDTTWFRRKAMDNTNAIAYSETIRATVTVSKGDTSVYGNQQWNIYGFNGNQISLAGAQYRGYYTSAAMFIDTHQQFGIFGAPSDAAGYQGCPVNNENFIMSARRTGFAGGRYRLDITNVDDELMVLVDGNEVYKGGCCINLDMGILNAASKVELRLREGGYITRLIADLVRIDSSISEYQNPGCNFYSQTGVSGDQWFDLTDATGKMIASINPGNNNLGTLYMNMKHFGTGTASIPRNPLTNTRFMPRYMRLYCSNYPSGNLPHPVKIRFYFRNSEFEDYKTVTNQPALTREEMKFTHYSGPGEDCDWQNNNSSGIVLAPTFVKEFTTAGYYMELSVDHFSEFGAVGGTQTLPVTMMHFKATPVNDAIQLNWSTAQELGNKGFEVLRSADGKDFVRIGWVDGHGTTGITQRYSFIDRIPFAGRNFYRLRQVDIDNNSELSEILLVNTKKVLKLSVTPNPVENTLYVEMDEKEIALLKIVDLQGRVLWKSDGLRLSTVTAVPVQGLLKGVYLLEVLDKQGNRQVERFVKR